MAKYYFTIQIMTPNPNMKPCTTAQGDWRPPKAHKNNRKQMHQVAGGRIVPSTLRFRHDGALPTNQTRPVSQLPDNGKHFKTFSVYHNGGFIWSVPYDATESQVGDGYDYGPGEAPDHESDERDSGDDEAEDTENWAELSFGEAGDPTGSLSYAGRRMRDTRLLRQRRDQLWVEHFLPDRYQSRMPLTTDMRYGGLVGELPLLIALAALSQPPNHWSTLLPRTILNMGQATPGWQVSPRQLQHIPRGNQWHDRRGLVISVYLDPSETTGDDLEHYEAGRYGRILY